MATELWIPLIVGGIAIIVLFAVVNHVMEQNRLRRMRVIATTNLFMQESWSTIDAIPPRFLPRELRLVLAKVMRARLSRALRVDPDNSQLLAHAQHIEELALQPDAPAETASHDPSRGRVIRRQLVDAKRICNVAAVAGHISETERQTCEAVVDALCQRLLIDHLIDAGAAAETVTSYEEARALFERAMEELAKSTDPGAVIEIAQLERRVQALEAKVAEQQVERQKEFDAALDKDKPATPSVRQAARGD